MASFHFGHNDVEQASRNTSTPSRDSESTQDDLEIKKARKREQDRLCQRRKREKDRENLRRLEARLNGLQNPDEPKVVLDLILRHEKDQERLTRQADRLRQIESLIQSSLQDMGDEASASGSAGMPADSKIGIKEAIYTATSNPSPNPSPTTYAPVPGTSSLPTPTAPGYVMSVNSSIMMAASQYPPMPQLSQTIMPADTLPTPAASPDSLHMNKISEAMSQVPNFTPGAIYTDDAFDQHIIIMVLTHGWDAVVTYIQLDPLWTLLRQIDGSSCAHWNKIDRMVGMLSFRRLMKAFAMGPQSMNQLEPKFLRPRPSQLHVPHLPNGDYFPWPGVRERFVFEGPKYLNDSFLTLFNSSTRFIWNSDFSRTYTSTSNFPDPSGPSTSSQPQQQLFRFSDELMSRFNNLSCWRIDAAFIAAYPEFSGDIPTYNSVPRKVDGKGVVEEVEEEGQGQRHGDYFFGMDVGAVGGVDGVAGGTQGQQGHGQWVCDNGRWFFAGDVR